VNWRLDLVRLVIDGQSEGHGVTPINLSTKPGQPQAYSAYGSTSSPDCVYIASMEAGLLLGADEIRQRSTRSRQGAGTCRGSLSR